MSIVDNRILVVGDAMLDRHTIGNVTRISPEAPVPVVSAIDSVCTAGGAANVACQVAVAAQKTVLLYKAIRGVNDSSESELRDILKRNGVAAKRLWMNASYEASPRIPEKNRVWAETQQVCRVDKENTEPPTATEQEEWIDTILRIVQTDKINKVIFSDYDKGCLDDDMLGRLAVVLNELGVVSILDPKRPSFPSVEGLTIVKPNQLEMESTGFSSLEGLSRCMEGSIIVQTRGSRSTLIAIDGEILHEIAVEDVGDVVDVCGAGDVHCAVLALAYDGNIDQAVDAANKASAISVQHQGCYTLTEEQVKECLTPAS